MEEKKELEDTQKILEGEGKPQVPTEAEIAELKSRAEVSSQNFERAKKAEQRMKELEAQLAEQKPQFKDDDYSDEGRALRSEILNLKDEVISFKKAKEEEAVFSKLPQIKDKQEEFKEYLQANPELKGLSLEKSARLFIAESGLITEAPKRVGLEKPTSGAKGNIKKGWTNEEVKRLREQQPRKYEQMIRDGRLNPDEIVD